MGQFFTLVPVHAGFRCSRSDYGAFKHTLIFRPVFLIPRLEFIRTLRSFPVTLSLSVSIIRKAKGKGGLRDVR